MSDGRDGSERTRGDAVYDRIALGALGLVFLARLIYLLETLTRSPVLRQPLADSRAYVDWARSIGSGQLLGATPFYRAPLYPYLIAPFYAFHERPEIAIVVTQLLMGMGMVYLVWRIGRRLYGPLAGLVGLVLLGFYGPLAAQETKILGTSVGLFLSILALASLLSARSRKGFLVSGILLGLGALARPNSLLVVAAAVPILAGRRRDAERPSARRLLALVAGVILMIAPATLHNLAAGDFVLISSNGGMTFYHGNNEESVNGLLEPPARVGAFGNAVGQEEIDRRVASQEAGRPLRASQSSAHWWSEGIRFLARHPGAWVRLWTQKAVRSVGAHDYADNYSFSVERAEVPILRLFLVPFPLLLILAVAGLVLRAPRGKEDALMILFAALGLLTCLLFYVGSRYRCESVPALAILAGRGAVHLIRQANASKRIAAAVVSAFLLAVALVPPGAPAASQDAMAAAQWAAALERDGRAGDAARVYRWSARRSPSLDLAWAKLADLEEEKGGTSSGLAVLDRGIAAGADGRMLRTHRALRFARLGREREAEADYWRALQHAPGDPSASLNLAILLVRRGADSDASMLLNLPALRENVDALYLRGVMAVRAGRLADADGLLARSLGVGGRDPRPLVLRAMVQALEGKADDAHAGIRAWLRQEGVAEPELDPAVNRVLARLTGLDSSRQGRLDTQTAVPTDPLAKALAVVEGVRADLVPVAPR